MKTTDETGQPTVRLTITMGADGHVTVDGPIANKLLSYALLEMARDVVQQYVEQRQPVPEPVPERSF